MLDQVEVGFKTPWSQPQRSHGHVLNQGARTVDPRAVGENPNTGYRINTLLTRVDEEHLLTLIGHPYLTRNNIAISEVRSVDCRGMPQESEPISDRPDEERSAFEVNLVLFYPAHPLNFESISVNPILTNFNP
jgi:hypothetical protein